MSNIQSTIDFGHLSFEMISEYHRKLIDDFLISKQYRSKYKEKVRYRLLAFIFYLESVEKKVCDTNYKDVANFYTLRSSGISGIHINHNFNSIKLFLLYLFDQGVIVNKSIADSFSVYNAEYINIIISALNDSPIMKDDSPAIGSDREAIIENFFSIISISCTVKQYKFTITTIHKLLIFLDFINYKFDKNIIDYWVNNVLNLFIKHCYEYRKVAMRFYDFIINKSIDFKKTYREKEKAYISLIPSWAADNFNKYIHYRKKLSFKNSTIEMDCNSIYKFIKFMDDNGIKNYDTITPELALKFHNDDFHSSSEGKNAYQRRIRSFLLFLQDEGVISNAHKLNTSLHPVKVHKKVVEVIPDEILDSIYKHQQDFKSEIELRSYAIFLLGIRLGLRRIDIANLRFSDFDFKNLILHISQIKTSTDIDLPIPIPVANGVYKYLKYGRNKCNHDYVFTLTKYPYDKIDAQTCNRDIATVYRKIGFDIKYKGFHIARKTYASNNLRKTHSLSCVSDSLGHTSYESVKPYISIDEKYMKECTIGLSSIEIHRSFYDF